MRSRVRAVLMVAAVLGGTTWAQAQCSKDTDCKGDRVCDAGQCTSPPAAVAPATSPAPSVAPAAEPSPAAPVAAPAIAPAVVQLAPVTQVAPRWPLAPTEQPKRRRSTPVMVTGIVMTSAGPVVWLAGLLLVASAHASCLSSAGYHSNGLYSAAQANELNGCRDRAATGS